MRNYIFFSPYGKYWVDLTRKLLNQKIAQPILWICDDKNYVEAKKIFGEEVVQSMNGLVHYPHKIEKVAYTGIYSEFLLSNNYLKAKDRCLKMLDRLDLYGFFSRKDKEIYFHNVILWGLEHLNKNRPDFLLTVEAPHSHSQYVFYEICSFLKIPILRFNQWTIAPCIYLRRMDSGKTIQCRILKGEIAEKIKNKIESTCKEIINSKGKEYIPKYIKFQKDRNTLKFLMSNILNSSIPKLKKEIIYDVKYLLLKLSFIFIGNESNKRIKFFKNFIKKDTYRIEEVYRWFYNSNYDPINPYGLNFIFRYLFAEKRRYNLLNAITSLPKYEKPKENFVFFPLMFEHERTSNPDGGNFHDQLIALTTLRCFIPNHIKIIVKEHPTQYYLSLRGKNSNRGPTGRSPIYKNVIRNIKNTELIGVESNTTKIIEDSLFVASITGSVALEASLLEKKAIVFGETWFEGAPNIFHWSSNLNYDDFINHKVYLPYEVIDFLKEKAINTCALGTQSPSKMIWTIDNMKKINNYDIESFESIYKLLTNTIINL